MDVKKLITDIVTLLTGLQGLVKESRGHKRAILRELQHNINHITLFLESGADPQRIDALIARLQVAGYEAASKSGYDFGSLQKNRLKRETLKAYPQFQNYVGLSTEQLCDKLYGWIERLKIIIADYPDNPKFRKNVRLINIWKFMLMLVKHIEG